MSSIIDVDTVGGLSVDDTSNFYVNNTFYLLAPEYYYSFYSLYLNKYLSIYDGWINSYYNKKVGLIPQRMLQSIASGLNNMLFAKGIDFSGDIGDYNFITKWANKTKFCKVLKKAHKYAIAGGTSLLKINRENQELFVTAHRIDTFFVDVNANGKIISAKIYFDAIHNTNNLGNTDHFGICEERYFNNKGQPCVRASVYKTTTLQTAVQGRPKSADVKSISWGELPLKVKKYIKDNYPSILIGEEELLPFANSLGCVLMRFTDDIPKIPNMPFGQPIGELLWTESVQYDQMKYFERNEVDLARARALIPEELWNKDDPSYDDNAMSDRFYQKVSSVGDDKDKITPIQFLLRGEDIRKQKENIYKDCAFKLNISASSIASFLSEGAGAKTATEIVNERTKTDTWISGQISLNTPEINELLKYIMYYYNYNPVEIIMKSEDQSPFIERLKINSDVFAMGNMSPELFVKTTYKNLSQAEQQREIDYLKATKEKQEQMQNQIMQVKTLDNNN